VLTADAEFRAVANAAFDAWQKQPPYISYRVDVDVEVPALKESRRISRAVEARTRDDLAVLQDLPLDFHLGDPIRQHNPLTAVTLQPPAPNLPAQPIRFTDPVPSRPEVSVVSTTLRNYYAEYAPDSGDRIAHIVMKPLPALTLGNSSDFYLKDVYVDTGNDLPTRVVYSGPTTDFVIDYAMVGDHWLIAHAHYSRTLVALFHIGSTTFTTDAAFTNFTFPATPQDERLR
jgi:hypothetical protein